MIKFVQIKKDKQKDPSQCSQVLAQNYIKGAMNKKIQSLQQLIEQIQTYKSNQAVQSVTKRQILLSKQDDILLSKVNNILSNTSDISGFQKLGNISQILRIYRDILFDSQTRESRIVAGIKQQLNKAIYNKEGLKAYI